MDWIVDLYNKFTGFLYSLFMSLFDMLKDVIYWAIEMVLDLAMVLLDGAMALLQPMDISEYLTAIPPSMSWVFITIGLPNAMVIVSTAYMIRITLQLIPFTRLGS